MNEDPRVPSITDLQERGMDLRAAMDDSLPVGSSRSITVTLSDDEYQRIGGSDWHLKRLSQKVADFVNETIMSY